MHAPGPLRGALTCGAGGGAGAAAAVASSASSASSRNIIAHAPVCTRVSARNSNLLGEFSFGLDLLQRLKFNCASQSKKGVKLQEKRGV